MRPLAAAPASGRRRRAAAHRMRLGSASVRPSAQRMASKYICCTSRRSHVSDECANDPKKTRPFPYSLAQASG